MPLVIIFLVLPLVEIALFIVVGGRIGLWPTLSLTVLGGLIGVLVLRAHKARTVEVMKRGLRGVSPGTFLAQGAFQVGGGLLLILPGFLSDTVGLFLFLPPVQRALLRWLRSRVEIRKAEFHHARRHPSGEVIEGEYETREERPEPVDPTRQIDGRGDH
jgi:UPF0716 protein FxsA